MSVQRTLENSQSFSALLEIAQRATPQLSFWGTRSIQVMEDNQSLAFPIDILVRRVVSTIRQLNYNFPEDQREDGILLAEKINELFHESDAQVNQSNCITRFFVAIRELFIKFSPRGGWVIGDNELFQFYTEEQFQIRFGRSPEINRLSTSHPNRWMAPPMLTLSDPERELVQRAYRIAD